MTEEPTSEQIMAALGYIDKTIDNLQDLPPDLAWDNSEVLEMLAQVRTELVAAAGAAPQEPGVVCAWCPGHARGSAWHSDGSLHPSCGQIEHGGGWVPSWPGSVIDEVGLSNVLMQVYDNGSQPNALPEARAIIAKVDEWLRGGAR